MNSRLLKVQLAVMALLMLTVVVEWHLGYRQHQALLEAFKPLAGDAYDAVQLPELDLSGQTGDQLSDLIERPLFIEGRKPIAEEQAASVVAADNGQLDEWELIGVYFKKGKAATALFRKRNEAKKYLKLNTNQSIVGWTLQDIQNDRVVLLQNDQQKTLMLLKPRPHIKPGTPARSPIPARTPSPPPQPNVMPSETIDNES